jgi:LacI family transcriptional regulator
MRNKKRRASLKDVAALAGVSVATVDRVINERGRVKHETVRRVRKVAAELGVESAVYEDELVFSILLQDPEHLYYQQLGRAIEAHAALLKRDGIHVEIRFLADTSDDAVAATILEMAASADGIAGVFVQNTLVLEAVSRVLEQGKPVVTLLTDIRHPQRTRYVGLDNRTVGRTAGYIMGRLVRRSGRVLLTAETLNYLGLEEREMGFRSILLEKFPTLEMSSVVEKGSDRALMARRITGILQDEEVVGVFNAGGRNSVVAGAIAAAGRERSDVVFIGSELTETSRKLLIEGWLDAVVGFPVAVAADSIVRALLIAAGRAPDNMGPAHHPLQIVFAENAAD